jgi:putative ABC transport system permease protein
MSTLRTVFLRFLGFLLRRGGSREDDLRAELAFHTEMLEADLRARGASAPDAVRAARLQLGGTTQIAEAYGDQRSVPVLESLLQDARYAVRTFRRAPAFTLAALLTLAIGIGATTAIFSVVNAVLLRPLPYPSPEELVVFTDGAKPVNTGYATFDDIRARARAFEELAAIRSWQTTLVTSEAERLQGLRVSANYFTLLGVRPALGRTFRADEDHPERYRVVMLSDGLWRRRFNADPSVIGRRIEMNSQSFEVIGVMPADFADVVADRLYQPAEVWAALGYEPSLPYACRTCRHIRFVGRMKDRVTLQQAGDDVSATLADLERTYPTEYAGERLVPQRLEDAVSGPVREPLVVLLGAVGFVLLIACANVANLLLARAMNRSREMAVRAALGAGRGRLVRQLVTESSLLWAGGGLAGLAVGAVVLEALLNIAPMELPAHAVAAVDLRVMLFSAALSMVTGLLFGLVPALGVTRHTALHTGSRGVAGGHRRARQALVVVDLAVALVLLVGAGLMFKSVSKLLDVNPGFDSRGVVTAQFSLVGEAYREDTAVYAFIEGLLERVRAQPGVEAVAVAGQIPMGGNGDQFGIFIEGRMPANPADAPSAERYSVTPDYFRVMRIPLLRGRLIEARDTTTSEPVMLVSETADRTLFGGTALGRRVRVGRSTDRPWRTVVGIVGDVSHANLTDAPDPQMYLPQSQFTDSYLVLTARVGGTDPVALVPAIRQALRQLDPSVPLYDVAALDDLLARSTAQRRFVMMLLVGFAGCALLLAGIGLYGVISYTVTQRTREVGVRLALGASRADILKLVLGSGAATAAAGVAIGLAASAGLTRFLQGQLFEVEPFDPAAIAAAVGLLAIVGTLAHVVPTRRALRVDPTTALRQD